MQPSDRNIHKFFFIETLIHTNTSSKTTHRIKNITHKNNAIHAHAYYFMPWEFNPSIMLQGNLAQVSTNTSRESNPSRHLMGI
jgi:hypothetical protein